MNKRHYEHTLPNIRGSLSNTYEISSGKYRLQFLLLHVERLERGGMQSRVWRHVPAFLEKMVRGDRQGHIRRGGTVLSGTLGRQPQDSGGTGRLDI